ncbi:hypothetical protein MVES1_000084 [Malassezia vespertilionis]|uniref:uncharacterized protein n=1 Tax=Malassezia vespertilionis TaxID=2020962 RepID=UPI0024B18542|nr:uncharacterized protein MVES1_000084 [Malassezia vespertilionis]WFD04760.1 hypothetical protein MVES1_000084 [Malassezia vespertilionis]
MDNAIPKVKVPLRPTEILRQPAMHKRSASEQSAAPYMPQRTVAVLLRPRSKDADPPNATNTFAFLPMHSEANEHTSMEMVPVMVLGSAGVLEGYIQLPTSFIAPEPPTHEETPEIVPSTSTTPSYLQHRALPPVPDSTYHSRSESPTISPTCDLVEMRPGSTTTALHGELGAPPETPRSNPVLPEHHTPKKPSRAEADEIQFCHTMRAWQSAFHTFDALEKDVQECIDAVPAMLRPHTPSPCAIQGVPITDSCNLSKSPAPRRKGSRMGLLGKDSAPRPAMPLRLSREPEQAVQRGIADVPEDICLESSPETMPQANTPVIQGPPQNLWSAHTDQAQRRGLRHLGKKIATFLTSPIHSEEVHPSEHVRMGRRNVPAALPHHSVFANAQEE